MTTLSNPSAELKDNVEDGQRNGSLPIDVLVPTNVPLRKAVTRNVAVESVFSSWGATMIEKSVTVSFGKLTRRSAGNTLLGTRPKPEKPFGRTPITCAVFWTENPWPVAEKCAVIPPSVRSKGVGVNCGPLLKSNSAVEPA